MSIFIWSVKDLWHSVFIVLERERDPLIKTVVYIYIFKTINFYSRRLLDDNGLKQESAQVGACKVANDVGKVMVSKFALLQISRFI